MLLTPQELELCVSRTFPMTMDQRDESGKQRDLGCRIHVALAGGGADGVAPVCSFSLRKNTVDGKNPAPPGM